MSLVGAGTGPRPLPHVAIIGAGVIGLSIAWRLSQRGCLVDVFDVGRNARTGGRSASTWASAGLLAPGMALEPVLDTVHALSVRGLGLWPDFADELEQRAGLPIDFRDEGALSVAFTEAEEEILARAYAYHDTLGTPQQWLSRNELLQREPALTPMVRAARFITEDRQVDPRALLVALRDVLLSLRVPVRAEAVQAVELEGARPVLVSEGGRLEADFVVLAAGAWSRDIAGLPEPWRPPVDPVKGQMLAVEPTNGTPLLRHALFTPDIYMAPRQDGRLLVGATVEERGFDETVTAGGMRFLLSGACRAIPGIDDARIVETWSGFRPRSMDGAPIIGFRDERLLVATGHYRNGVLLAPVTAEAITECVLSGATPDWIAPFAPDRFDAALVPA